MKHLKFGIPLFGIFLGTIGIASCSDENPWSKKTEQTGGISVSLATASDIKTAKPVFRSDDDDTTPDPNNLSTYIQVPTPEDFTIKLEKADGSYSKTWSTLADFKEYNSENSYETGNYVMTAYYGEKGKQDFDAPYFEATSSFTILANQVSEINLNAELMNSMVKVNYTDGFKDYMKDYHTAISTEGRSDEIICVASESRPVFIEPNKASMTVHFTTKNKEYTSSVPLGEFAPLAKTLHNITLDITESTTGDAQLQVSFDDTLDDEDVFIDLTEELLTTPAPVITTEGFTSGETLDMLAGTASESSIKMQVKAKGVIAKADLTVESVFFKPTWGSSIDFCAATEENRASIKSAGIDFVGFDGNSEMAWIDLTSFCKSLPKGIHTITLKVTDKNGAVSETAKVTLNSEDIEIDVIETPAITYASGKASITLDYNGANPDTEVKFFTPNANGNSEQTRVISCEEVTATRAFDKKRYIYTIEIPNTQINEVEVEIYHNTKSFGKVNIPVTFPTYEIVAYDAFSRYAYVKVNASESELATVIENLDLQGNGKVLEVIGRDSQNGILTVTGLTPATTYEVKTSLDKAHVTQNRKWNENVTSFKTESELEIPNGDFSQSGSKLESGKIQTGGQFTPSGLKPYYTHHSSFSYTLPYGWATVNEKTAYENATNKNTWYYVPSSWLDNGKGLMRSVGYSHNGPDISISTWAMAKYSKNAPSSDKLTPCVGEIFLGTYIFNGTEIKSEGIDFASRPNEIRFDYEYSTERVSADHGFAYIEILDAEGNSLGAKTFEIEPGNGSDKIELKYEVFGRKAAKLKASFKSSKEDVPPINIPSGEDLNDGESGNADVAQNSYHAVATGSVLKIDNVTAVYGNAPSSPAQAPKKTTKVRK